MQQTFQKERQKQQKLSYLRQKHETTGFVYQMDKNTSLWNANNVRQLLLRCVFFKQ